MNHALVRAHCLLLSILAFTKISAGDVIINEIMFHPASENSLEEFIELYNKGTNTINLQGWSLKSGVSITITNPVTLAPGEYLALAADREAFRKVYPNIENVVGGWTGTLANSGENITLANAKGDEEDSITYADDKEWGVRVKELPHFGHRGWTWESQTDGLGASLELINPTLPNKYGLNWGPSPVNRGTPGEANASLSMDSPPLIVDAKHFPMIPKSTDPIAFSARIIDELSTGIKVRLRYRLDGTTPYSVQTLLDDGLHGDQAAGDGIYGIVIPPLPNNSIVEFYFEATDASGQIRFWPPPALIDGGISQSANMLLQVDDTVYTGKIPLYKLIIAAADQAELAQINRNNPAAPFPGGDQTLSHAQMNATFISIDGTGMDIRYNVSVRNRGNGSRTRLPQSYRLNLNNAERWKGVSAINLNSQFGISQIFGAAFYRKLGLPMQESRPVQVRVNNQDGATPGAPTYGFYSANEVVNGEFADRAFEDDNQGNVYRGIRITGPGADLGYLGELPDPYRENYFKQTNVPEDDWRDLINFTRVLNGTNDVGYLEALKSVMNVEEWVRYFAIETLDDNRETNLANGSNGARQGDDYFMYRGVNDPRFWVVPYDVDTIFNMGDSGGIVNDGIFRMTILPALDRFIKFPDIALLYYADLKYLIDHELRPAQFDPFVDAVIKPLAGTNVSETVKTFAHARAAYVDSLIPKGISITNNLIVQNGYPRASTQLVKLGGRANPATTRYISVNGVPATWSIWETMWSATNVVLAPGINRVLVQGFDASGKEVDRNSIDIWYDNGVSRAVTGTLSTPVVWTAADGPYLLNGSVQVTSELRIDPGTTVYLGPGANLSVSGFGRLVAQGTESQHIRLTHAPSNSGRWGGVIINNASQESSLSYVDFDFAGGSGPTIQVINSVISLDHLSFSNAASSHVSLENSSFKIQNSAFPTVSSVDLVRGSGIPVNGYGIFENNTFSNVAAARDAIHFSNVQRPAVLQILNNTFAGGTDDLVEVNGADAHIEGNLFLHAHAFTNSVELAGAISAGKSGSAVSHVVVVRNFFFDCDYMAIIRDGSFGSFANNTAVKLRRAGIAFDEPALRTAEQARPGQGAFLDGSIIWDTPANFENVYVNDPTFGTVNVSVNRSILSGSDLIANGTQNSQLDPHLVNTVSNLISVATITRDFRLLPGTVGVGAGPNGLDIGAAVPARASISGEPPAETSSTEATLLVGGPGYKTPGIEAGQVYRWRLNDGPWSGEIPIDTPIRLAGLESGKSYAVSVIARNDVGIWQSEASPTISKTWTINPNAGGVILNELLANNETALRRGNSSPDAVELRNTSARIIDLSGMGLSDDFSNPYRFTFPLGTFLAPGAYLVLYGDNDDSSGGLHLGFGLKDSGGAVYLHSAPAQAAALLDSVVYGTQIRDLSIGRLADGSWGLTIPTFGAANVRQPLGDVANLRINEWLALPQTLFDADFIELYNADTLPVALGGLFFTDNTPTQPALSPIPALSFIAPGGFSLFTADGQKDSGHVDFGLSSEIGTIALTAPGGRLLDYITYFPQQPDISQGRSPSGSDTISSFTRPSPLAQNPTSVPNATTIVTLTPLVTITNLWSFNDQGLDLGTAWRQSNYDDRTWGRGRSLLYVETADLPAPKNTPLTFGFPTYYFRTHFTAPANIQGLQLNAQFIVDDGVVVYLNGSEAFRLAVPAGAGYATPATRNVGDATYEGPFDIPVTALRPGDNVLAVEVHQINATSSDIVFGMNLNIVTTTSTYNEGAVPVVLNEILASNTSRTNALGQTPDWIEFYNPATNAIDLAGVSLTDNLDQPQKFVFPPASIISGKGFLSVMATDLLAPSGTNIGFNLNANGGELYMFHRPTQGGVLLDSVLFGNQAQDYSISRIPDGAAGVWKISNLTLGATNQIALVSTSNVVRINEWFANGDGTEDWFELVNPSASPVDVSGLYLSDDLNDRSASQLRPLTFIGPSGFLKIDADGDIARGPSHVSFKLGAKGDTIGLFDKDLQIIDTITFGAQEVDVSEGRLPDGKTGGFVRFPKSATPGESNYLPLENVVINEVLVNAKSPYEQAIEFYNPTAQPVSLGGWYLSDSSVNFRKFRFANNVSIPAQGYAVVYQNQLAPVLVLNKLREGTLYLSASDAAGGLTGQRAVIKLSPTPENVSIGAHLASTGTDYTFMSPTFGIDSPANEAAFRTGLGAANKAPLVGPLVINEIFYRPLIVNGTNSLENTADEFIEIRNVSNSAVNLAGWRISNGVDFSFPTNLTVSPGGYIVVTSFDPNFDVVGAAAFRLKYGLPTGVLLLGPFSGRLDNNGEAVELSRTVVNSDNSTAIVLADRVRYSDIVPWPIAAGGNSLQKSIGTDYGNEPRNWFAALPTAGRENGVTTGPKDTDFDGIPDEWEIAHGFNPNNGTDALLDPDGDGMNNLAEYLAGTDPTSPTSSVRFISAGLRSGNLELTVMAPGNNRASSLEFRDTLGSGQWQTLSNITPQSQAAAVTITVPAPATRTRFYRLISP